MGMLCCSKFATIEGFRQSYAIEARQIAGSGLFFIPERNRKHGIGKILYDKLMADHQEKAIVFCYGGCAFLLKFQFAKLHFLDL